MKQLTLGAPNEKQAASAPRAALRASASVLPSLAGTMRSSVLDAKQ